MKVMKYLAALLLSAVLPLGLVAADKKDAKAKPYPLKTCVVSDEKLDSMGEPYVFTSDGQEVKLCCKACLKDFNKDKAKYLKKIETTQAKPAK